MPTIRFGLEPFQQTWASWRITSTASQRIAHQRHQITEEDAGLGENRETLSAPNHAQDRERSGLGLKLGGRAAMEAGA